MFDQHTGETLSSATTVEQLGAGPGQSVELQVQTTPLPNEEEAPVNLHPSTTTVGAYRMPEVFTVQVAIGRETREVLVRVERPRGKKPFLGGYQHKVTGVEYHHASTQTLPERKADTGVGGRTSLVPRLPPPPPPPATCVLQHWCVHAPPQARMFDRDTQTVVTRNKYQQATADAATQMVG